MKTSAETSFLKRWLLPLGAVFVTGYAAGLYLPSVLRSEAEKAATLDQPESPASATAVVELPPLEALSLARVEGDMRIDSQADEIQMLLADLEAAQAENSELRATLEEIESREEQRREERQQRMLAFRQQRMDSTVARLNEWFNFNPQQEARLRQFLEEQGWRVNQSELQALLQGILSPEQLQQMDAYLAYEDHTTRDTTAQRRVSFLQRSMNLTDSQRDALYQQFYEIPNDFPGNELRSQIAVETGLAQDSPEFEQALREYITQDRLIRAEGILTEEQLQVYSQQLNQYMQRFGSSVGSGPQADGRPR